MIKAVVFDIDGVIIDSNWNEMAANFCKSVGIDNNLYLDYIKNNKKDLLLGRINEADFWQAVGGLAPVLIAGSIKNIWLEELKKLRQTDNLMLILIADLRKNYKVGALTNVNHVRLLIDNEEKLFEQFDFAILSCNVGLIKPDAKIFQLVIDEAQCNPSEIVYIDNNPIHVEAAKDLGFQSVLYIYNQSELLRQSLAKLSIKF